MKIESFLVDLDGVIVNRADYFSKRAETLYPEADHTAILSFFTDGLYAQTTLGEIGLEEALTQVIESWKVEDSVQEILDEWFSGENTIDQEVLNLVQTVRKQGIKCVIATDHSEYRKNDVWNNLGMQDYFDGIISSSDIGATKGDAIFFTESMKILEIEHPEGLLFTDDDPENVKVAESLGIRGIIFEGLNSLKEFDFDTLET